MMASGLSVWLLRLIGTAAVVLAMVQVFGAVTVPVTSLYLLIIACAALVFPEIEKLSFGKDGLSLEKRLERIDERVEGVRAGAAELSSIVSSGIGGKAIVAKPAPSSVGSPRDPDDPQAGRWGNKSEANGRRVSATVRPSRLRPDWFKIDLLVESTDSRQPLTGTATFHLHPTFQENVAIRPVIDGCVKLDILAWGAFTVGVETDDGKTQLEINLAEVPGAPKAFTVR